MAVIEETEPLKKGPSLIIQLVMLLAVTAAAIGMGWFSGRYLDGNAGADKSEIASAHGEAGEAGASAHGVPSPTVSLPAITTNLAAPDQIWVRLEVALVFETPPEQPMLDEIHQDLLGFLRTVKLHQIEGASGFQHLKADLEERAQIRSNGAAKKLLIRTLIFE
ncbi:flagellar basal body-associated protein FliL [Mesorhizobium sp. NBSH29]|uniref:flagellar basal body-associated FliL family protein n=1 Tax=Mesorhizobium sp. NBSH29 TaxID=2654249 RepID=UPI0018968829|nr:flagellar basal body-associated FliL family protein [Mesorhizobium sp. NBSH29]QPC85392.1 flagellar basal body-associated protein FliL [Mesorhizobium sp. NBSH29]